MKKELIELRVNGRSHELALEPNALLLDVLRRELQLTGSKRGCDDSSCGACTVLVDGVAMMSCTLLAASCEGQEITTIEGVSEHGSLAAIQKAYGDWGGAQCGYCTPGFVMTVKALLAENPDPSEADVRSALSSNLCRCTGYNQMYAAIREAIGAERVGTASSQWKSIFVSDGSLRDIWVCNSNASDWQTFLDWLSSKYSTAYFEDGARTSLPRFEVIWGKQNGASQLLKIDLGGFAVIAHFFSDLEIEMDVRPEDVDSVSKAECVFKLMSEIGLLLKKEVILAPEGSNRDGVELKSMALCSVDPTSGFVSFHQAYTDVVS